MSTAVSVLTAVAVTWRLRVAPRPGAVWVVSGYVFSVAGGRFYVAGYVIYVDGYVINDAGYD